MEQSAKKTEPLYLEDLSVGQRFVSDTYQMDEQRMKAFAQEFDPQPFHLDEAAGKASFFGVGRERLAYRCGNHAHAGRRRHAVR